MTDAAQDARREPDGGPSQNLPEYNDETRELTVAECWTMLGESGVGHLGVRAEPVGVDIVPINYLIKDGALYFRSGPGTKLVYLVKHPHVAVQVEHFQGGGWSSVVLKGEAVRLAVDEVIERSGVRDLVAAQPGGKYNYVRVTPRVITGRTFAPTQ